MCNSQDGEINNLPTPEISILIFFGGFEQISVPLTGRV